MSKVVTLRAADEPPSWGRVVGRLKYELEQAVTMRASFAEQTKACHDRIRIIDIDHQCNEALIRELEAAIALLEQR